MSENTYFGEYLLSKVIDENNYIALGKYGITEEDFITKAEKDVYRFIVKYAEENRLQCPSAETVANEIDGFEVRVGVQDSFEYLTKQLKSYVTQIRVQNFMQQKAMPEFEKLSGLEFIDWMTEELQYIKQRADYRTKIGTDLVLDTNDYLAEYERRKAGESFKVWKSAFPSMPDYLSANMYTWYARSGRGKSVFTMVEAVESAMQGATVLIWAMEMSKFEWLSRAYTYISAKAKLAHAIHEGQEIFAGFTTNELLKGELSEDNEEQFRSFLQHINSFIKGKIIIRAVDDSDFHTRTCKQLESDILQTKADVVVIDPVYYMTYERNESKTAGGDVANTSKKIRHIAGYTKTVIHVITQSEEVRDDRDEDGNRELRVPTRAEIKKTKAVLEDAVNVFGIDTCDGNFIIELGKGRNGGEGLTITGTYIPSIGLIYEAEVDKLQEEANKLFA